MPRFAANLSLLFTELPFLDRFAAAADAGFQGVEYLFPYDWPASSLAEKLQQHHLTQVLFNLPPGDWQAGERGIACLPDRVEEFREGVFQALEYAEVLDCPRMNCLAGIRPESLPADVAFQTLVENLRFAADLLAAKGMTLTVEAINSKVDMPGFFVDTSLAAMTVIEAAGRENIRVQFDAMNRVPAKFILIGCLPTLMRLIIRAGSVRSIVRNRTPKPVLAGSDHGLTD